MIPWQKRRRCCPSGTALSPHALRFGVCGLGSEVWGAGFEVWGLGFGVEGLSLDLPEAAEDGVAAGGVDIVGGGARRVHVRLPPNVPGNPEGVMGLDAD